MAKKKAAKTNKKGTSLEANKVKTPKPAKAGPRTMTVGETKYGLCVLLSVEDCETLGISKDTMTRPAIDTVRSKLGLPTKAEKREAKKEA